MVVGTSIRDPGGEVTPRPGLLLISGGIDPASSVLAIGNTRIAEVLSKKAVACAYHYAVRWTRERLQSILQLHPGRILSWTGHGRIYALEGGLYADMLPVADAVHFASHPTILWSCRSGDLFADAMLAAGCPAVIGFTDDLLIPLIPRAIRDFYLLMQETAYHAVTTSLEQAFYKMVALFGRIRDTDCDPLVREIATHNYSAAVYKAPGIIKRGVFSDAKSGA